MGDDQTPDVDAHDVYPHTPRPLDEPDHVVADYYGHVQDRAHIDDVLDAIETLVKNGFTDDDTLVEFGRHMSALIFHGGLTPSEAKARAAEDVLRSPGTSKAELAERFDMTRGAFGSLASSAGEQSVNARALHYMTLFGTPLNLVFDEHMAAEPPAPHETRYILLEVVDPRTEEEIGHGYDRHGPVENYKPPEPQYVLVKERYADDIGDWSADDPSDRRFGQFVGIDTQWYMDTDELVAALYEETYFNTEDRARVWKRILEEHGFRTESEPQDRLNPDVLMDREND